MGSFAFSISAHEPSVGSDLNRQLFEKRKNHEHRRKQSDKGFENIEHGIDAGGV